MALSKYERKERLPYGEQGEIAKRVGVSSAFVSLVMNDKTDSLSPEKVRKVQKAIAKKLALPVSEVFAAADNLSGTSEVRVAS